VRLAEDTAAEEHIGERDLTRWPSRVGQALVDVAVRLAGNASTYVVLVVTAAIGGAVVVGLTAVGAEVYEEVAERDGIYGLDRPVLNQAISWRTATAARLITSFTNLGGLVGMSIIATAITLLMLWRWRSRTPLVLMLIAVAGSLTMTTVGKAVVGRARPPLTDAVPPYEYAFSFPSGHALNSTVIAGLVAYLLVRRLRTPWARGLAIGLAVLWAVSMGLSRVYLGHHWLTDVVFAWSIGAAWLALLITAHRLFLTVRRARRDRGIPDEG